MSARAQRKKALIAEITAAFDGVSREGGVSLRESWVIDDYGTDEERAEARARDTDTRWQDVPDDLIESDFGGAPFLIFVDEIGFRYYLPACMIYGLRHMDDENHQPLPYTCEAISGVEWILMGGGHDPDEPIDYENRQWSLFTWEQRRATARFLELMEEDARQRVSEGRQSDRDELFQSDLTQEEIEEERLEYEKRCAEFDAINARLAATWGRYWKQFL